MGDKTALGTFLDSEGLTPGPGQGRSLGLPSPPPESRGAFLNTVRPRQSHLETHSQRECHAPAPDPVLLNIPPRLSRRSLQLYTDGVLSEVVWMDSMMEMPTPAARGLGKSESWTRETTRMKFTS